MAMANDMSNLLNKIENRLGLIMLDKHLPSELNKESWANIIQTDTLVTFSRYFPNKVRFVVNDVTCEKRTENKKTVYYIRDEYLQGHKLLGVIDIDWADTSQDNLSVGQTAGYGYYVPNYGGMEDTLNSFLNFQSAANIGSLYNNNIFVNFEYPNKISICRAGNVQLNLSSFVVDLLVQHEDLATISPTKMEVFESLAQADVAKFLFMNLRYFDGLETAYVNIDLKLSELEQEAGKRQDIVDELKNSYVSASNDNIPYIMTVSG
jgi:hypothetical protein